MNMTFKQLEAFIGVVDQGTFDAAARHLNLAQSAISRQISELEEWFGFELFDRKGRAAKLNALGREVAEQIRSALLKRDVFDACLLSNEVLTRKLRIGITELTALTWLPNLVKAVAQEYPRVAIEPVVDLGSNLKDQLAAGRLDIAVLPDAYLHEGLIHIKLHSVHNSWYCSPDIAPVDRVLDAREIPSFTLLAQGKLSGAGIMVAEWLKALNIGSGPQIPCNNLVAVIGLAISGLGIAYIPDIVAAPYVRSGQLVTLMVTPKTPDIPYVALARADSFGPLIRRITEIISEICRQDTATSFHFPAQSQGAF